MVKSRKSGFLWALLAAPVLMGVLAQSAAAATISYFTVNSLTAANEPVVASALFTVTANHVTLLLTNLQDNPKSAGSLLGGIDFTVSGSGLGNASNLVTTGSLITFGSNNIPGAYNGIPTPVATEIGHWNFTDAVPNAFTLRTSGNDPLIIGYGNGGTASDPYTASNPSLDSGHQPFIQHSALFSFDIQGLTESTVISYVSLRFTTDFVKFGASVGTPPNPPPVGATVPVPAAAWSGMALLAGLGGLKKLRRRA